MPTEAKSGSEGFLPILHWLPRYERRWLRADIIAGVAVVAMIVPKNLGDAEIAGIPVQNGLYAAAAALPLRAVPHVASISTGPSSALATVAGGVVIVTGVTGGDAAQLVAAITLVTGILLLLLALFRMGWIAQFLSKAVVTGFLAGAAIDVVVGELPKLTGTSGEGDNVWREFASWIVGLGAVHLPTLVVGAAALAVILALRFWAPKVPGALVLVVGGLIASSLLDLGEARSDAGRRRAERAARSAVAEPSYPAPGNVPEIVIAALALLLIGFSQTAGDARSFATRHRYRIDVNQEAVAQGMANVGAGLVQGMPVSTSLSASSLTELAGARTPVASLTTGGLVILTLLFLAPLFSELPKAVLAAIIIDAVVFGMIDLKEFSRLRRVSRFDLWIAVAAWWVCSRRACSSGSSSASHCRSDG